MKEKLTDIIADQRKILKLYGLGALLFFIGIGFIQWADKLIPPSLQQESFMLLGILIAGSGFSIAMFSQILLILHRFRKMGRKN
ncbi:hypothetical protein [Oceanicoccus sp. KOV_DT_Chl]|uniref:hypothetical protein n=1 Tax=Oceanicoccus sp. KOV_DT_Chl TaxID=1904639 RepID=UPI000C7E3E72|nr:hypothetical protein [Oceanicoccus sp. KOV_DT_Chl]